MRTIIESDLPPHLRHFLHVLAFLAKSNTGVAWHSQEAIGRAMGVSGRMVRTYFVELEKRPDSPVRVERRRRGTRDGKGRSSDEWRLLLQPEVCDSSTGSPLPLDGGDQPEVCDSSTGSLRQLNRKPTSGDLSSERSSERRSSVSLRSTGEGSTLSLPFPADAAGTDPESTKAAKPSRRRSPKESGEAAEAHRLKQHYVAEFTRTRGCEPPIAQWSRAMKAFEALAGLKGGIEGAEAIITRALSDEYTKRIMPWELLQDAPKHVGQAPRKANGRAPHVQRGVADGVEVAEYS